MPLTPLVNEVHRLERLILIGLAVMVGLLLAEGWVTDYRSCKRANPARIALAADAQLARESVAFWLDEGEPEIAARARKRAKIFSVPPLSCFKLLPGA